MNTHLYKHLPPKTHLEVLGGASAQWSFRSPFLTRYSPLARVPQHPEDPRLWGKGGCTPPIDAHTSPQVISSSGSTKCDDTKQGSSRPLPCPHSHCCCYLLACLSHES